ncbi:DUF58 domain-containing protein [Luteimonas sp. A478]
MHSKQKSKPEQAYSGVQPTLAELVALRAAALARRPPRRGQLGAGQAPSPLRGRGMEYAESREYAVGDDARHIDWRVTARSGKPHTKLFQAERERVTLVVADTAPALYFGTRVRFKSVQAARAGALAVWAAVGDGDRVAALRGSSTEPPVKPAAGPRGALRVLDALVRWYAQPPPDDEGLDVALEHAARVLRPGSRLLVLADPASLAAVPDRRWPALAMHNQVVVLLPVDPLESDPPAETLALEVDGGRRDVDLGSRSGRAAWDGAFAAPLESALTQLPRYGVRAMALPCDGPGDEWLPLFSVPGAARA